ncbi:MAG: hypothetical protein OXC28_00710 [Defluviicoccus sp.]|nr:hypothetical protein [Defluviicoccus sp.]
MSSPDSASRETLTRQQRNLALTEPIARLSRDRRMIFRDEPALAERFDLQYLALSAIDFVMERSAIESGASPEDVVEHVAGEAVRMKPALTEAQGRKAGQVVLDHLSNAREGHRTFRAEYFDADRGGFSFQDFRLLALSAADDGSPRYKLARGAQTLTLAMLDIAPEFAQEAEAIMIRKAVERGRLEDARMLARRSRMRSIHYRQFIEDRLFQVRRAADRVRWSEEVLPELDEARTHLDERRKHEAAIVESIRENMAHAEGDTRHHLVELKTTIDDCQQRHAALFERVMTASEEFRRLQASAFRARLLRDVPDLEDRILFPLLAAPMASVAGMGDGIAAAFAAPSPPPLLDLALLFETLTQPAFRRDPAGPEEAPDLEAIERVPPEFDADDMREAQDWLVRTIAARTRLDMHSAIGMAEDQGMAEARLRCVLFLMLRSWCPEDDPLGVIASIDGAIAQERVAGDNLVLARDAGRWPG